MTSNTNQNLIPTGHATAKLPLPDGGGEPITVIGNRVDPLDL